MSGLLRCLVIAIAAVIMVLPAQAQSFPTHPITLVVPFPPGGGVDAMGRIIADKLSMALGQQVVVDRTRSNKSTGAYKTVADLIAAAKKEPGKINIGSSPKGAGSHLCAELFMGLSGTKMKLIPYKGMAQSVNDLVAVASLKRSPFLPDVPTVAESGLSGFEAELYYGLLAPAGTPKEIVDRLRAELRKALASDDVKQRIASDAATPLSPTSAEYAALLDRDEKKWAALIRQLGLKVQ